MDDDAYEATEKAADAAAARCEFQLTYARSPMLREFGVGMLTGLSIPDAYRPGRTAAGEWCDADAVVDTDPESWIDRYANYAINEGVHEVLEWFRVDGKPWLDPHGPAAPEIYEAVNALAAKLADIRRRYR